MTHEERLKLLQTWYEKGVALEKASDEVCKVFGVGDLDRCAILAAAWGLWDAYTAAVAAAAGAKCPGMDDWCTWWWYENKHGQGGLDAHKCLCKGRFRVLWCVYTTDEQPIYEDDIVRVCYKNSISEEPRTAVGVVTDVGELVPIVDFGPKVVPLDRLVRECAEIEVLGNTCENPDLEFEE